MVLDKGMIKMDDAYYIKELGKSVALIIGCAFFFALILMLFPTVSAYDVYGIADNNTIRWNWSYEYVNQITIDGGVISDFMPNTTEYQITFYDEISPTTHKIIIYENGLNVGMNETRTTHNESYNSILDFLSRYVILFIGIILIYIGIKANIPEIAMISFLLGIIGVALYPNDAITMIIYGILVVVSIGITFKE